MNTVKVSPKYQVVIPENVRKAFDLRVGERVCIFQYDNRIEFIPEKNMRSMRGFLKGRGVDSSVEREADR
jgi:AbrB family looped-hinge helix DNA binding protein